MEADPLRYPLVPAPRTLRPLPGSFRLDRPVAFDVGRGADEAYDIMRNLLPASGSRDGATVHLAVEPDPARKEGYTLTITPGTIQLVGTDAPGLLHGTRTVRQLLDLPSRTLPCVYIEDAPGLRWRGLMLDVARYYMPVSFIYRLIELLASYKLNVLHLHLTDDQGWRIEVPGYPLLTEVGAWRAQTLVGHHRAGGPRHYDGFRHGGFYTARELRAIVAFAERHAVRVVPEIDLPGHVQAALAAYPFLGSGAPAEVAPHWGVSTRILHPDERTLGFCHNVLSHVLDVFPSEFIHCGGDEASTEEWGRSPRMRERIAALGLPDLPSLHHWFTTKIATFLAERGRRYVGWDEIVDFGAVAPGSVVMAWRDQQRGVVAADSGIDVVMAPRSHVYLDQYQGDPQTEPLAYGGRLTLEQVHGFEPVPADLGADAGRVLGAEAQLWTEYVPTPRQAEYQLFPRLCAFAEAAWTPDPGERDTYSGFLARLRPQLHALTDRSVNYRPLERHVTDAVSS